jgi:hypothetical protein
VNSQLEGYQDQLLSIRQQVPGLVADLTDAEFAWPPAPGRWSMAHCFDHLNAAARAFVPVIERTTAAARARGWTGQGPFTHGLLERLFIQMNEPPPRLRMRAPRVLAPKPDQPMAAILDEFMTWQDRLKESIRTADGLDLRRARGRSPAFPLITWSLGAQIAITLAHERRHLWQAQQVRNGLEASGSRL